MKELPIYIFIGLADQVAEFTDESGRIHRVNEENLIECIPRWERTHALTAHQYKSALAAIQDAKKLSKEPT